MGGSVDYKARIHTYLHTHILTLTIAERHYIDRRLEEAYYNNVWTDFDETLKNILTFDS